MSVPSHTGRVLLVGMMGAGKTTVARLVGARLGWPVLDSDAQVEARTGRSVAELFDLGGEPAFRALESEVLADALASTPPAVIAVAGGAVLDPRNRRLMRERGTVVWLRAKTATLADRIGATSGVASHRPLLGADPAGTLTELDACRRPLYEEVADAVIDVDEATPEQVADQVLEVLGVRAR